jgi:plastocyanin
LAVLAAVLSGPSAGAATKTVTMQGQAFTPKTIEISAGDTVIWEHGGSGSHTVTADNRSFDSSPSCPTLLNAGCMNTKGDTYTHQFPDGGTFPYHCKVHGGPGGQGMSGTVVVKGTSASTPTTKPGSAGTTTTRPGTTATTRAGTTTSSRPLSTSSTVIRSTTTTAGAPGENIEQNEPPSFDPGDDTATGGQAQAGSKRGKGSSNTVPVIVALLLAVASGGGLLLWRLRPRRS